MTSSSSALDTPRSLTAVNVTDTTALLLWQPAVATVDGYVITYSADAGEEPHTLLLLSLSHSHMRACVCLTVFCL